MVVRKAYPGRGMSRRTPEKGQWEIYKVSERGLLTASDPTYQRAATHDIGTVQNPRELIRKSVFNP